MIRVLNVRLKTNEDNIADAIRRIESLENNIVSASTSPSINQEDILAEWNERITRSKHLCMPGIAENDHPASSNGNDLTKVRELLLGKLEVDYTSIFVHLQDLRKELNTLNQINSDVQKTIKYHLAKNEQPLPRLLPECTGLTH